MASQTDPYDEEHDFFSDHGASTAPVFHPRLLLVTSTVTLACVACGCSSFGGTEFIPSILIAVLFIVLFLWARSAPASRYGGCGPCQLFPFHLLAWLYPCDMDGATCHVAGLPTFPLILRNTVQLGGFAVATIPLALLPMLARYVPGHTAALTDGPVSVLVRCCFGVYIVTMCIVSVGVTWTPSVCTVAAIKQRVAELHQVDPIAAQLRRMALMAAGTLLESAHCRELDRLCWLQVGVPIVVVLALTAVYFLTMGMSNWMAVRDAPAFWILSICVLWVEIQCFIPLQFLLNGEFNRLVLECVRRMQAFGLLLHQQRLELAISAASAHVGLLPHEPQMTVNTLHAVFTGTGPTHVSLRPSLDGDRGRAAPSARASPLELVRLLSVWSRARSFVLEVDCNQVFSSASPCIAVLLLLGASAIAALAIGLFVLKDLRRDLYPYFFATGCLAIWSVTTALRMANLILQIFLASEQQYALLDRLREEVCATHQEKNEVDLLFVQQTALATRYIGKLCDRLRRLDEAPVVLGIAVRPTLINVIKGYAVTGFVAVATKLATLLLPPISLSLTPTLAPLA